ncbi:aminotransferase class IV [Sunxiuqinia sp. A32]|uniref:aminotransferase class IV n=1 Tax=Sunxiuqinia sp. A32 TaxID=3461496 RepID=UPI004045A318
MIGFNNGIYQDLTKISIPITSISINRGYGAFEFLELLNGKPFYGDRHLKRFLKTLNILKLKTDFDDQLEQILKDLIEANDLRDSYIKLFALPHDSNFHEFYQSALYVFPTEMPNYPASFYSDGVQLAMKQFDRFLPLAKSTNYLAGQFWMNELTDERIVDILFHDGETVQETSRGNVFMVKDGAVVTPAEGVLKGVTRGLVLELLPEQGILHVEAPVRLPMLLTADEVFLTSTTKHILPVVKIDDHVISDGKPGEITKKVIQLFEQLRTNFIAKESN